MSTARRVISGSIASWMRIGVTMISQIILVPIYLRHWDVITYGVWIAIQALVSIISTLDQGHQTYLEFEFLKDGKANTEKIAHNLWSSVWIALGIGLLEITCVIGLMKLGFLEHLLGVSSIINQKVLEQAGIVLLLQTITWAVFSNFGGVFVRVLSPFGYFSRMSWWGVSAAIVTAFSPVIAVMFGADLLQAGVVLALCTAAYAIPQYIDIFRLMKKEGLLNRASSLKTGFNNFFLSLAISGKGLLENARQQGVRVILAPLSGATALVAFSTMRTGANIALQGLNTITSPLMPELMRFLNNRDQPRMVASFSTIWLVVITLLAPGVIVLQAFASPLFYLWTQGQVAFDPLLFALLSLGVLIYAIAQPAMAIVRGNNLLIPQLIIAVIAAFIVVAGMFFLVPVYGIVGAGISLLVGELAASICYRMVAKKWLARNGLQWPRRPSLLGLAALYISAISMFAMYFLPSLKWLWCISGLLMIFIIVRLYLKSLPPIALLKLQEFRKKIPLLKNSISYATKK